VFLVTSVRGCLDQIRTDGRQALVKCLAPVFAEMGQIHRYFVAELGRNFFQRQT